MSKDNRNDDEMMMMMDSFFILLLPDEDGGRETQDLDINLSPSVRDTDKLLWRVEVFGYFEATKFKCYCR
jgi:hypothetical protein